MPETKFKKLLHVIQNNISKPWTEQTIDSLYLLNGIQNKYPNVVNEAFLCNTLGTSNIICEESLANICDILMVSFYNFK